MGQQVKIVNDNKIQYTYKYHIKYSVDTHTHPLTHFLLAHMFFASICPCLADLNIVSVVTL
jgi:hypothetical protein